MHTEEPLVVNHDKPVEPKEVLVENQKTNEPVVQPSIEVQTPSIPFPRRLRKEKKEAQQKRFLENLKQLHINLPFIQAPAQMPKYAKFLKIIIEEHPNEDDDCYGIDDLDDTINIETQELLANDKSNSFLLIGLEKSINQSDLESCESLGNKYDDDSDLEKPIRRIDSFNTLYSVAQEIARPDGVKSEHLYSASANEIDEKKHELKILPRHLKISSYLTWMR
ncbi:hypothetical protein Tco_1532905 [Tanacetum coccineum]